MTDKKMTAKASSVGADERQSNSQNIISIVPNYDEEINGIPDAVFPDYAFANDPDNQVLQIVALVLGAIVTLLVGFGVAYVVKK